MPQLSLAGGDSVQHQPLVRRGAGPTVSGLREGPEMLDGEGKP